MVPTTTTETKETKQKKATDLYTIQQAGDSQQNGKPVGAAFVYKKGKGMALLLNGK